MATLIRTNGDVVAAKPANGVFTLQELYALVCPGDSDPIVEAVYLSNTGVPALRGIVLWCHEEGKLRGLPTNTTATAMFGKYLQPGDYLVGDILITNDTEVD